MRILRILLASLMFIACLGIFLDFTGVLPAYLGWVAKIQFIPSILAFNVGVFIGLVILTLLFGRIYCSVICPLGIFQDIFSALRTKKQKYRYWNNSKVLLAVRYGFLVFFIAMLAAGLMSIASLLDPYSIFGRMAVSLLGPIYDYINNLIAQSSVSMFSTDIWIRGFASLIAAIVFFVGLIVSSILTGRGYCNTVCPVGTILGLLGKFSLFKVRLESSRCVHCQSCASKCKGHCINIQDGKCEIDYSRCVVCLNCLSSCKRRGVRFGLARKSSGTHAEPTAACTLDEAKEASAKETAIASTVNDTSSQTPNTLEAQPDISETQNDISETQNDISETQNDISETQADKASSESIKDSANPDRRGFIQGIATASLLLLPTMARAEGELAPVTRKDSYPRETRISPPGSRALKHFSRHCTGCMLCVRACHNKVLRVEGDGLVHAFQPIMSFEFGYCRPSCNDCSTVCPTGAIRLVTLAQKSSIQIGHAVWEKDRCINTSGKGHGRCKACGRICPNGAISYTKFTNDSGRNVEIPVVDGERCIGCGACEYVCPARPLAAIHVEGHIVHREI